MKRSEEDIRLKAAEIGRAIRRPVGPSPPA
jgi:hypothetical protein